MGLGVYLSQRWEVDLGHGWSQELRLGHRMGQGLGQRGTGSYFILNLER